MPLYKRFLYYFGGFSIGILILFFFLSGKKTSCDYGPNARTLKNIRKKERVFSEEALLQLRMNQLDTSAISLLLKKGDVLFSESNTKLDSCNLYAIKGWVENKNLKILVENCDKKAKITSLSLLRD